MHASPTAQRGPGLGWRAFAAVVFGTLLCLPVVVGSAAPLARTPGHLSSSPTPDPSAMPAGATAGPASVRMASEASPAWLSVTRLPISAREHLPASDSWGASTTTSVRSSLAGGAPQHHAAAGPSDGVDPSTEIAGVARGSGHAAVSLTHLSPSSGNRSVTFVRTGMPLGVWWSILLGGDRHATPDESLALSLAPGSYNFSVPTVPGFLGPVGLRSLEVGATNLTVTIAFVPLYTVAFVAFSIPSGLAWNVTLNGTTTSAVGAVVIFAVTAGNYSWSVGAPLGYRCDAPSGVVNVGGTTTLDLHFSPTFGQQNALFTVRFLAYGLDAGTWFSIVVNNTVVGALVPEPAVAVLANGSYDYAVEPIPGYEAWPSAGSVEVQGRDTNVSIQFVAVSGPIVPATPSEPGLGLLLGTVALAAFAGGSSGALAALGMMRKRALPT